MVFRTLALEYDGAGFDRVAVREQVIPIHVIRVQGFDPAEALDGLPVVVEDLPAIPDRIDQQACRTRRIGGQRRTEHVFADLEDETVRILGAHGGNAVRLQQADCITDIVSHSPHHPLRFVSTYTASRTSVSSHPYSRARCR